MATIAEHRAVASSSSPMPTFEPDIDTFLNLDQLSYAASPEPSRIKPELKSQPSVASTDYSVSDGRSSSSQSPLAFQAPSHQYDEYTQQTGLPPGGLAHAMAFNINLNDTAFPVNGDLVAGNHLQREGSIVDFRQPPSRNPSEMDLEADNVTAMPTYYFPTNPTRGQFVDPSNLNGQEVVSIGPLTQVGRMYPGMHQQQAAMAKAVAQQQKQHEVIHQQQFFQQKQQQQLRQQHEEQQQQRQQQQKQQEQQQQLQQHLQQQQEEQQQQQQEKQQIQPLEQKPEKPRNMRHPDPEIEERITLLLQQMKRNAISPGSTPGPSSILPQLAKIRKEEQDMDEDERLLASDEGKRLSSKERRQLRNKVSARAFRSRRKGIYKPPAPSSRKSQFLTNNT